MRLPFIPNCHFMCWPSCMKSCLLQEGSRIPAALDTADVEASTLSSPQADAYAEQPWSARLSSPLPSPQKQLLAELTEASKYLQGLNARLDVERDTHANE